jgi:hypothetical protein
MIVYKILSSFFGSFLSFPNDEVFVDEEKKGENIRGLVKTLYVFNLFYAFSFFKSFHTSFIEAPIDPLWPSFALRLMPFYLGKMVIASFYLISSLLVLTNWERFGFRLLACLGALCAFSLPSSYGSIYHADHLYLFALFGITFFPFKKGGKDLLIAFSALQGFILFTYSLSGMWKFLLAIYQLLFDSRSAFHPLSMAEQVSYEILTSGATPPISNFILEYPVIFMPVLLGGIYVEMFSLYAFSRPNLHRLWGFLLILLHIGTYLFLQVGPCSPLIVLGLFLVNSPFRENSTLRVALRELPVLRRGFGLRP